MFPKWKYANASKCMWKCSPVLIVTQTQTENTVKYHRTPMGMTKLKIGKNDKCWWECRARGTFMQMSTAMKENRLATSTLPTSCSNRKINPFARILQHMMGTTMGKRKEAVYPELGAARESIIIIFAFSLLKVKQWSRKCIVKNWGRHPGLLSLAVAGWKAWLLDILEQEVGARPREASTGWPSPHHSYLTTAAIVGLCSIVINGLYIQPYSMVRKAHGASLLSRKWFQMAQLMWNTTCVCFVCLLQCFIQTLRINVFLDCHSRSSPKACFNLCEWF